MSSDNRGRYRDIDCFNAQTCPINFRRFVLAYALPQCAVVSHGSRAFLSYFFSSSTKVFFICNAFIK